MNPTVWIEGKLYSVAALLASGVKPLSVWNKIETNTWQDVCYATCDGVRRTLFTIDGDGLLNVPIDSPFVLKDNLTEEAATLKEVRDLCASNLRIQAIKAWRAFSKCGLKEAKDFVDTVCPPPPRF